MSNTNAVYVTVKEAARILSVCTETIRRMLHQGEFPNARRLNRQYRIPLSDLLPAEKSQLEDVLA